MTLYSSKTLRNLLKNKSNKRLLREKLFKLMLITMKKMS